MKTRILYVIFIMCVALWALSGCSDKGENLEEEKGLSEIRFIENQCITIFNKYFSNEYISENGDIDWNLINEDFDVARNSIDIILIDFAGIQIPSKSIVELENCFNDVEEFLSNQDINRFIKRICDIYNLVSYSILNNMSESEEIKLEKKAKSDLLYVGYYIMTENKEFALSNLDVFQDNFTKLSSTRNYVENNSYKINKVFINIQNLETEINDENFERSIESLSKILEIF